MDDNLSRALRSLPRERARPGFTGRVLRRLDEGKRRPASSVSFGRPWPAAAAGVLILAVGGWLAGFFSGGPGHWWRHHQREQGLARLATLESERRALLRELESLQRQVESSRPLVYLGGSNDIDLVLDLDRLRRSEARWPATRPSALPPEGRTPEGRTPEGRTPEGRTPEGRTLGGRTPDVRPASFSPQPTIY